MHDTFLRLPSKPKYLKGNKKTKGHQQDSQNRLHLDQHAYLEFYSARSQKLEAPRSL